MVIFKKGAIIGLLVMLALVLSPNAYSAISINEILANGLNDPNSEWIELYNNESSAVDLTNWSISESFSSNFTFNTTIPANSFVILTVDFNTFNTSYRNVNLSGIIIINITISNFNLADTSGEVRLYNSSSALVDSIAYVQASGKTFENVSIGRYPDGNPNTFNLSTLTPGAKNDNQAPKLNKWLNPSLNNTNISGLFNVTVNVTDDTVQVNSSLINFNGINFPMDKNGDIWYFLWNTSLNLQKKYNITVFFNDSYGKNGFDTLFNITVNNSPFIVSFSPSNLFQTLPENSTLNFNVNASDPDDTLLNFSWFIGGTLNSTALVNFSYTPSFTDNGTHTINVTIKDASLNQVSIKWTVVVTNLNRAPILEEITNKNTSKNVNLSFNITATDLDNDVLIFSSNKSDIAVSKFNNSLTTISWRPTNLELGNNSINFTVSDGFLTDSKIITITVNFTDNTAPAILTAPKIFAVRNEIYTYDVEANDTDNDTLRFSIMTNASGVSIDSSNGIITFTPSSVGFFIVNVSVTDFIEIVNQSYNLTVLPGNRLKIVDLDVKVDGKKSDNIENNTKISREAKPSSEVQFKLKIKNDFLASEDTKIEDIKVGVTIEEIDGDDDLEEESKEFDLDAQDDKTVTLKFQVPLEVDEDTFDVLIEAEGEDENGNTYQQHFKIELDVEKEKHGLRLLKFELSPTLINCNSIVNLDYTIINLGQEDEENIVFGIKNNDLGLDFIKKDIALNSGTEDNMFSDSIKLKIDNNAGNGIYPIIANIYSDDGKVRDAKIKEINVEDCIKFKGAEESEVVLITGKLKEQEKTKTIKEAIQTPTIKIIFKEENKMLLLALSTLIFAVFFVFTAIVLYARF